MAITDYLLVRPDWNDPVAYRRRWQTTILSALEGTEQRSSLLTWPRRTLAFTLLSSGLTESSAIVRRIYKNLHQVWGVPYWQDRTVLTAQAASGQKVLAVRSSDNRNFEVGGPCILLSPSDISSYEAGTIAVLAANQITLAANLVSTWPVGSEVYPILQCRLKTGQSWKPISSRMGTLEVEATEEFDDQITRRIGDASAFDTYYGYPILDRKPNVTEKREIKLLHPYDLVAWIGKSCALSHYRETLLRMEMGHVKNNREDVQEILDFFDAMKGRLGVFWLPTWTEDIRITGAFGAGDLQLSIEDIDFATYFLFKEVGTYITILFPDGSRACNRVVAAPTGTTLILDTAIGKACTLQELPKLLTSFLIFCRFDLDEIETRFLTDYIAETSLSFQTLLDEAPGGLS